MATYLSRDVTRDSGTAITKLTFSAWIKRSKLGEAEIFNAYQLSSYYTDFYFDSSDRLNLYSWIGSSEQIWVQGHKKFRDVNAWYHIVLSVDTTQSTASDRVKFYVNGELLTSMNSTVYPSQNSSIGQFNDTGAILFVGNSPARTEFLGSMSHIHYTPYTAYDATPFGETDSTTGEWKIKTSPSVTYSSVGWFVLKDGNSVTDQSGNSNNLSINAGTLTKTEDCPSNVFATMNALSKSLSNVVLSKGNTICRNDASADGNVLGTIALGNGKYYWETYKHGGGNTGLGITLASVDGSNHSAVHGSRVNYYQDGYIYQNGFGLSDINTGVTYSDTDIISVSVDTENGTIKFYKNGVLVNNSSQTNSVFTYAQNELIPFWYFSNGGEWRTNFGNGYFGTTAITTNSGNGYAGAEGASKFNYTVPTGYSALSTKGLNE